MNLTENYQNTVEFHHFLFYLLILTDFEIILINFDLKQKN